MGSKGHHNSFYFIWFIFHVRNALQLRDRKHAETPKDRTIETRRRKKNHTARVRGEENLPYRLHWFDAVQWLCFVSGWNDQMWSHTHKFAHIAHAQTQFIVFILSKAFFTIRCSATFNILWMFNRSHALAFVCKLTHPYERTFSQWLFIYYVTPGQI